MQVPVLWGQIQNRNISPDTGDSAPSKKKTKKNGGFRALPGKKDADVSK